MGSKRGEERKQYDMEQEEARKLADEEYAKREAEKAAQEAEEIRLARATTLIHKPEPITQYKPVAEMKRKQPTLPKTPNAARAQNRQPRQSRRLRNQMPK